MSGTFAVCALGVVVQYIAWALIFEVCWSAVGLHAPSLLWPVLLAVLLLPVAFGVAGLLGCGCARAWREEVGGRAPTGAELLLFDCALAELRRRDPHLAAPASWFVLDTQTVFAGCRGRTLLLTSAILQSELLPAALAHELSHLHSRDGLLTAALAGLAGGPLRPLPEESEDTSLLAQLTRPLASILGGQLALRLLQPAWGAYFRCRELHADRHAAQLGQAAALIELLERFGPQTAQPFPLLRGERHPPIAHRVQRLYLHSLMTRQT